MYNLKYTIWNTPNILWIAHFKIHIVYFRLYILKYILKYNFKVIKINFQIIYIWILLGAGGKSLWLAGGRINKIDSSQLRVHFENPDASFLITLPTYSLKKDILKGNLADAN